MRRSMDLMVRVSRDCEGAWSSKEASLKEVWNFPHFPEVAVFEVAAPSKRTFWFGVALYRLEHEVDRKLRMGAYIQVIPGMEKVFDVAVGRDEPPQGICVTLTKDDCLKGSAWELAAREDDPSAGPGQNTGKKFEEWKGKWRDLIAETEKELSAVDGYWHTYKKKGAKDAEGEGGREDLPAAGAERAGLEPEPVHGDPEPKPARRRRARA